MRGYCSEFSTSVGFAMAVSLNQRHQVSADWSGSRFLRFIRVLYCSPKVKMTPADAAILLWFSRLPDERLGKRVSI